MTDFIQASAPARSVVFVDSRVQDAATLLQSLEPGSEVVFLQAGKDGLEQMAAALGERSDVGAVQVIAHGSAGQLWLGSSFLDNAALQRPEIQAQLAALGRGLTVDGDLLIYACNTAEGSGGAQFVSNLAALTGADVAASDDRTGSRGDWTLEITTGTIEASSALSSASIASYGHDLATLTVTSNADTGAGTLRNAIASALAGDTITFQSSMTVGLTSGQLLLNKNLIIDGDWDNNGTADVTIDANHTSRVFNMTAGNVTLDGLVITKGLVSGNGGSYNGLIGGDALGGGISVTGGVLTLKNSAITANKAAAGGGNGGGVDQGLGVYGYGGGGGGGFAGVGGGHGGAYRLSGSGDNLTGSAGSGGTGGIGGYANYAAQAGKGGSSVGGAGGTGAYGLAAGGNGGRAGSAATGYIGGGGAGVGGSAGPGGGRGGNAVGGMYIGTGATVYMSSTSITNNLGAGGGGGGSSNTNPAGNGGVGVGGIWNRGTLHYESGTVTSSNNFGQGGLGGASQNGQPAGAAGSGGNSGNETFVTTGGTTDPAWTSNAAPTIGNLNGDSVAWAGVGNTVRLDVGSNASLADADLGALNGGNGNWSGASLVIQRNGTAVSSDVLGFDTSGALFTVSGNNLQSGGQTFATFTNSSGVLTISFTSSATTATTALVNDVAQRVTYRSDTPAGDANVKVTLNDGAGASATANVTVASDTIYVTNATDTATINPSNGTSFSEAVAIAAADSTGTQTIVFASSLAGQTLNLNTVSINESLTLDMDQASGLVLTGGTITLGAGTTQTFTDGAGDTATISSIIAGSGALSKTGAGNLTLSGAGNTFSGSTTVSAGTLTVSGGDAISANSSVSVGAGATLALAGSEVIGNLSGAGSVTLGTFNLTSNQTADTTFSGAISGSGGVTFNQAGASTYAITLSGTNTYTGATILANYGWLKLDGDASMSSSSAVRVNGNGTLTLLSDQTIGSLAGNNASGKVQLGNYTLTAGGDNTSTTLSGVISGSGSLVKQGGGTLSLAGANTFTGASTVLGGTLEVNGSTAGATTVGSGAVLSGSGALGGDVLVQSGGTFSPGASGPGDLTVNGNLTLASGSTLALDINGGTPGTGYDRVFVNGTVDVSGATLAVTQGYVAGNGVSYTLIVNDAADAVTGTFSGVGEGATFNAAGNGTTLSASYTGGTGNDLALSVSLPPTVTAVSSSSANGAYKIGDVITVTVQFDSAVNVTDTPTLQLETGAIDRLINYVSGSGTDTLIFSYAVQAGDVSADLDYLSTAALSLNGGTIQNYAGQSATLTLPTPGAAGSLGANKALVVDGVRPTLASAITISDAALRIGDTATVTFTFTEAVSGFTTADVTAPSGVLSGLSSSDGGITWTATLTPSASTTAASNVLTLDYTGISDAAGNAGTGNATSGNYVVDTARPTATVVVSDAALTAGETSLVTITFSEAVTGFDNADLTAANSTLSAVSSADGGITWTATLTPTASVDDATNVIALDNTGVTDLAGNAGTGTTDSNNYTVNTLRPTASIVVADTALAAGETSAITITFSEAVTGFTNADLTVANGTLSAVSSSDGGITWTATLTPAAGITDTTNLITLDNTGVANAGGNTGTGTTDSNNYAIDTARPTATVVVADTALAIGETSGVSITFSEAVTGFSAADLTAANGTLSNLSTSDNITYTATFTPSAGITDTTNVITLDNTGVIDAAGNAGTGTTDSNNYVVDTLAPVLASATVNGKQLVLTYTEAATLDATNAPATTDFTVAVGATANTVTAVAVNAAAKTVTLTLTAAVVSGQAVTVAYTDPTAGNDNNAIQDAAGNDAASFAATSATNLTPAIPDPEPEPTPPTPVPPTPPTPGVPDNDGIPPTVEDQTPGIPGPGGNTTPGDGNGDGIKDSEQPSVGSIGFVLSPTGESNPGNAPPTFTTLVASSQDGKVGSGNDNARITSLTQKDAPTDLPAGMQMPIGLVSFTVELGQGRTGENFSLYVDPALGVNGYWKENASGQWVNIASEPYGGKMVMEGGRLRLDFHIEDGGQFDADGKMDGIITDPGAPGHMALSVVGMAPDMPHGFWF
jgi:autotransporter-associated beta strand protein